MPGMLPSHMAHAHSAAYQQDDSSTANIRAGSLAPHRYWPRATPDHALPGTRPSLAPAANQMMLAYTPSPRLARTRERTTITSRLQTCNSVTKWKACKMGQRAAGAVMGSGSLIGAPRHSSGAHTPRSVAMRSALQPVEPGKGKIGFIGIGIMGLAMVGAAHRRRASAARLGLCMLTGRMAGHARAPRPP